MVTYFVFPLGLHAPEKEVSITFPFCSHQHSDHRMLEGLLKNHETKKECLSKDMSVILLEQQEIVFPVSAKNFQLDKLVKISKSPI